VSFDSGSAGDSGPGGFQSIFQRLIQSEAGMWEAGVRAGSMRHAEALAGMSARLRSVGPTAYAQGGRDQA
jgi:hypothetical protein